MTQYIGKPFKDHGRGPDGYDCIGLVLQIYKDNGIEVPDIWKYDKSTGRKAMKNFLLSVAAAETAETGWVKTEKEPLAMVVFKVGGILHAGVMLDDEKFIHALEGTAVCMESLNNPIWANRVKGFYKWST